MLAKLCNRYRLRDAGRPRSQIRIDMLNRHLSHFLEGLRFKFAFHNVDYRKYNPNKQKLSKSRFIKYILCVILEFESYRKYKISDLNYNQSNFPFKLQRPSYRGRGTIKGRAQLCDSCGAQGWPHSPCMQQINGLCRTQSKQ